ncbi:MAG: hypothetical protein ACYDA4_03845 [Ignavibacteriaceae bacterium]
MENELFKIDKSLYGIIGKKPEGLTWKHDRLYSQYKRKAIGNDKLFKELQEISVENNLNKLANKVKMELKQDNLFIDDEMKLNDICLKVIETALSLREESVFNDRDREGIYDISIKTVLNQEEKIGKYIFDYDIDTIKNILNKDNSNTSKIQIINRQLATTKTLLELLEETTTAKVYGDGSWGIYTRYETLSRLIEHSAEQERIIFNRKITNDVLKRILTGLKERLNEFYIYLRNEYDFLYKTIEISRWQNKDNTADMEQNQTVETKIDKTKFEPQNNYEKESRKDIQAEDVRKKNSGIISYDMLKQFISSQLQNIDITEKADKYHKVGNQIYKITQGEILLKVEKYLGINMTFGQKNTIIKYIQKCRSELLLGKKIK